MTDQELADAIRERFGKPGGINLYQLEEFVDDHPKWEPKWGDKVKHGANPKPRWYVAPNPQDEGFVVVVDEFGTMMIAQSTGIRPWEDES